MKHESYSDKETAERFQRLLRAAIRTPPSPLPKKKKAKRRPRRRSPAE